MEVPPTRRVRWLRWRQAQADVTPVEYPVRDEPYPCPSPATALRTATRHCYLQEEHFCRQPPSSLSNSRGGRTAVVIVGKHVLLWFLVEAVIV